MVSNTKSSSEENINIPEHIAIIMDGNRRWAKKNKLQFFFGHKRGVETFEKILEYLGKNKAKVLTVYAFSTENWKRDETQVQELMKVISQAVIDRGESLFKNNVIFKVIGRIEDFPAEIKKGLEELIEKTKKNTGIILNLALSYGGRDEIVRAANKLINSGKKEITEDDINSNLDTAGQPEPGIIIRTGGDARLSNFLLWQSSYSELFFTDTLWPDFSVDELKKIIEDYKGRKRNFGK